MPATEDTSMPESELHPHDSTKFHEPHNPSRSEASIKSIQATAQFRMFKSVEEVCMFPVRAFLQFRWNTASTLSIILREGEDGLWSRIFVAS